MSTADGRNARKLKVMHVQMDNPGSEILDISDVCMRACVCVHVRAYAIVKTELDSTRQDSTQVDLIRFVLTLL